MFEPGSPEMGIYRDLAGKKVVVTGGASGIGAATAERFAAEGCHVVAIDRNLENVETSTDKNPSVRYVHGDVSVETSATQAMAEAQKVLGGLDVLIANAGISVRNPFLSVTGEQWDSVLKTNLYGCFYTASFAAKTMAEQKSGVILMTASTNGLSAHTNYVDYNVSKAGVLSLARTMALELAPHVRVNAVNPGYVLTPMQKAEYTDEMLAEVDRSIPLGRHADPFEVAALFAFLASEQAAYITGQGIAIDGGETA